jgi:hypothetical protein
MRRYKRITKDMVRQYFGTGARIRSAGLGAWRVTTPTGGEAIVTQTKIRVICNTEDVSQASVLLSGEAWGGATARDGSREFMLGAAAHAEAWGVPLRADYTKRSDGAKRFFAAFFIVIAALKLGIAQTDEGMTLTLLVAFLVYFAMRHGALKKARRETETMGFHYPRIHGAGRGASREEAARKGWL